MTYLQRFAGVFSLLAVSCQVLAWGAAGHQSIGAIADALIVGTNAATQTQRLLGGGTLSTVAVWADCAKGVVRRDDGYTYAPLRHYPECAVFETPDEEARMIDFVQRNDVNCHPGAQDESCHRQYHYSDIAVQRGDYVPGATGSSDHDVVAAAKAAIAVLRGASAPAPFAIDGGREALLLLAHYVGDMHQPLHVGAVYLDDNGDLIDPDQAGDAAATATRGGNAIRLDHGSLHALWDSVPARLGPAHALDNLLALARQVAPSPGDEADWPQAWAGESVAVAARAFNAIQFGPKEGGGRDADWPATLPDGYTALRDDLDRQQLARAGARLAQVLMAIWP